MVKQDRLRAIVVPITVAIVLLVALLTAAGTTEPGSPSVTVVAEARDTRTVRHVGGETTVPLRPSRVATIGYLPTDTLVAMGMTPVAADTPSRQLAELPRIREALLQARSIGRLESPSFEALIAANPEAILIHDKFLTSRTFRRLSQIAPTVGLDGRSPEELLSQVGRALGFEEEASDAVAAHIRRLREARDTLSPVRQAGATVAIVRLRPRVVRIYGMSEGPGRMLYDELGLQAGPGVPRDPDELWANISLEDLGRIQADHIFLGVDPDAADRENELRAHPLWSDLPAVQSGNVHEVPAILWIAGDDAPIGSAAILEDVVEALAPD